MQKPQLSIEEISRYIDGQMEAGELAEAEKKLAQCAISQKILQRMRELTATVSEAILNEAGSRTESAELTDGCLDDETLIQLSDGNLSPAQQHRIEAHAASCSRCLSLIMENVRSAATMGNDNWKELPPEIKNDPRLAPLSGIKKPERKKAPKLPETFEADAILKPGMDVVYPFTNEGHTIQVGVYPQNGGIANIEMVLTQESCGKSQAEITLNESATGRKIFRGLTGSDGRVLVRRLRAGEYDIHLPMANMIIRLLLKD